MILTNALRPFRLAAAAALIGLGAMASATLAPAMAQATPDRAAIEAIIKDYLVKNPEVIQEAMVELERRQKEAEAAAIRKLTSDLQSPLYNSPHHTVVGNPTGDITLVEFFDYNCGFCKKGLADVQKLIETDKNVRVILKEFPILSPGSRDASIVALGLRDQFDKEKLWKFHATLMAVRGSVGKDQALGVAKDLGADMKKLETAMASPGIQLALEESKLIADGLGISGTPSYIVAEDVVVGARGFDELKKRVVAYRQCKKAVC